MGAEQHGDGGGSTAADIGASRRAGAGRGTSAIRGLLLVLAALATGIGFWEFYRSYIPQGDDLRFTAQRYHPFGAFTAHLWFHFLRTDYLHISGRTATAVGMLLMRPGIGFFRVAAPVICVWLMLACAAWLRPDTGRGTADRTPAATLVAPIAAAAVLPVTLLLEPRLNGDVLAWCMSFANYVLPTACLVTVAVVLLRLVAPSPASGRHRVAWPLALVAVPLALLTPSLHENMGTGMIALVAVSIAVSRAPGGRRLGRLGWTIVVLGLLGSAEILTAPGLWERVGYSNGAVPSGETGVLLRLHRIANGCAVTLQVGCVPLLVTAAALVAASVCLPDPVGRRARPASLWPQVLLVADAAGMVWAWRAWQRVSGATHGFALPLDTHGERVMLRFLELSVVFVVLLVVLAWRLRTRIGVRPLVALVTALGCGGTAIVSGVATPRAYMHMALWLALTAASSLLDLLGRLAARRAASALLALVAVGCVAASGSWLHTGLHAMRTNRASWDVVQRQFDAARSSGKAQRVEVPLLLPRPDYQFDHGFDLGIYYKSMVQWYDLPRGMALVQRP